MGIEVFEIYPIIRINLSIFFCVVKTRSENKVIYQRIISVDIN